MKSLWASIQGDPVFMRRVNGWFTIFWIAMIPVSVVFGLLSSVSYVSALSLWALVSGHWSAWQAARVEVEQMAEAEDLAKRPIEQRVVEAMVQNTDVEQSTSGPATLGPTAAAVPPNSTSSRAGADDVSTLAAMLNRLQEMLDRVERLEPKT